MNEQLKATTTVRKITPEEYQAKLKEIEEQEALARANVLPPSPPEEDSSE